MNPLLLSYVSIQTAALLYPTPKANGCDSCRVHMTHIQGMFLLEAQWWPQRSNKRSPYSKSLGFN